MTQKFSSKRPLTDAEEADIQDMIAADPDNPELTKDDFKNAKPFTEAFPDLAANMKKNLGGRPKSANPKQAISIRLSPEVLEHFKADGPGWQSRIDEALKRHVEKA
ncbi:MAG: BrnA antitoxin family protein [Alphaproteobacteria bacterium]|nr:BrnA antitoxin family protein [Alphaproteobacteria bacterium]